MKTYNIILKGIDQIEFPRIVSRAAQALIKRLCREVPAERLGYQRGGIDDIRKHRYVMIFITFSLRHLRPFPFIHASFFCPFRRRRRSAGSRSSTGTVWAIARSYRPSCQWCVLPRSCVLLALRFIARTLDDDRCAGRPTPPTSTRTPRRRTCRPTSCPAGTPSFKCSTETWQWQNNKTRLGLGPFAVRSFHLARQSHHVRRKGNWWDRAPQVPASRLFTV